MLLEPPAYSHVFLSGPRDCAMAMLRSLLVLLGCVAAANAFAPAGLPLTGERAGSRRALSVNMGKSLAAKRVILDSLEKRLESTTLIFTTDMKKISVKDITALRTSLPEGSNAICVKNTLMKKVTAGTPFEVCKDLSTESNLWFFIDEDVKGTIKSFKDWKKAVNKKEQEIKGGVLEGTVYNQAGIEAIGELPSKQELYAMIAGSIKAVPSKLAGTILEVPTKTARAIKLAVAPDA